MVYFTKVGNDLKSILNNLFLFKCTYIILAFISFIPITRIYLGFSTKLILIWGAYLIINRLVLRRDFDKKSGIFLLMLLICSYFITIVLNYKYDFARNFLNLSYLCVNLLVLHGLTEKKSFGQYVEELRKINFLIVVLSIITSLLSILCFIFLIKYKLTVDDTHMNQGFIYNRLYGVYQSANAAGMVAIVSIAAVWINLLICKRKGDKKFNIIYITNIVVQIIYIILSDSRGSLVGGVVLFMIVSLLHFKTRFINKLSDVNRTNILRYALSMLLCVFIAVTAVISIIASKKILAYIPGFMVKNVASINQRSLLDDNSLVPYTNLTDLIKEGPYGKIDVSKPVENGAKQSNPKPNDSDEDLNTNDNEDSTSNQNKSSGPVQVGRGSYELTGNRTTIWIAQLKVWKSNPIFGVANTMVSSNNNRFSYIKTLNDMDRSELLRATGNCHNGYIQLLVTGGISAFLIFVVFWFVQIKRFIRFVLFSKHNKTNNIIITTFAIVIALLINNMYESHMVFRNADFNGVLIWLYAGYLVNFLNSVGKSEMKEVI